MHGVRRLLAGGACLALLGLAACRDGGPADNTGPAPLPAPGWFTSPPPPLLQLGPHTFTRDQFDAYRTRISQLVSDVDSLGDAGNTAILNQFVENRMMLVAARDGGLTVSDTDRRTAARALGLDPSKGVALSDEDVLIQKFLQARLAGSIAITDADAEAYYNQHAGEFVSPTRYHIREILVDDPAVAKQIHAELLSGGKTRFGAYARQFSKAPSAEAQGDLGFFEKGQLPPEFEKIVLALKPGRFSDVVQTPYGFHIFFLEETIRSHPQKFYEVKDRIVASLRMEKERSLQATLLQELSKRYSPRVFKKALDFQPDPNTLSQFIVLEAIHEK